MADPSGLSALIEGMSPNARDWIDVLRQDRERYVGRDAEAELFRAGIVTIHGDGFCRITRFGRKVAAHLLKEQSDER